LNVCFPNRPTAASGRQEPLSRYHEQVLALPDVGTHKQMPAGVLAFFAGADRSRNTQRA
jgi:hypothetical protein